MATKEERNIGIDMQQAFSILPNQILLDGRLDNKSKIIWVYIQGKPKDWDFSAKRIALQLKMGESQTKKYLNELEEHGSLVRDKQKTGRVEYFLYCPPIVEPKYENDTQAQKPEYEKATVRKSHGADFIPLSNKDVLVIKKDTNKELAPIEITRNFFGMVLGESDDFSKYISSLGVPEALARQEIKKFTYYWTELNSTGRKQRWQMEKTFEVQRRLRTWFSNVKGFQSKTITNKYQAGIV
jgi:hypothetical protein